MRVEFIKNELFSKLKSKTENIIDPVFKTVKTIQISRKIMDSPMAPMNSTNEQTKTVKLKAVAEESSLLRKR